MLFRSEAYIHGMNGITECVRQIRGTSVNQVPGVEHVLATAGTGVPTSGLILGRRNDALALQALVASGPKPKTKELGL